MKGVQTSENTIPILEQLGDQVAISFSSVIILSNDEAQTLNLKNIATDQMNRIVPGDGIKRDPDMD